MLHLLLFIALAGLARTLFMEQRPKFAASIDLQSGMAPVPAATLAAALESVGEFGVAVRGSRTYSLRLARGAAPRARAAGPIRSALVTGGSKVRAGWGHPVGWVARREQMMSVSVDCCCGLPKPAVGPLLLSHLIHTPAPTGPGPGVLP